VRQAERQRDERGHRLSPRDGRDRLDAAQVALQVPGGHGVAEGGQDHHQAAGDGARPAARVHAEQHPDAEDPDGHAGERQRAVALLPAQGERQQKGEDRRARHQDPGERRGDVLLAEPDQRERAGDLHQREHDDRPHAAAQAAEHAHLHRERDEDESGEGRPDRDDRPRGEHVLESDLDEEIGGAPERAEREQQCEGPARHGF